MIVEDRLLNARHGERGALPLARAAVSGTGCGWLVESQRRGLNGEPLLVARFTHPDGERRLTLAISIDSITSSARGPLSTALTPEIGYIFRDTRSPAAEAKMVTALERVFEAGWNAAAEGQSGPEVLRVLQAAAFGLTASDLSRWEEDLFQWLTHEEHPARKDAPVVPVLRLATSGLSAQDLVSWLYYHEVKHVNEEDVRRIVAFHEAGWTFSEVNHLANLLDLPIKFVQPQMARVPSSWARLTGAQAATAATAGLSPAEALRMIRRGDTARMETLAALRQGSTPPLALV